MPRGDRKSPSDFDQDDLEGLRQEFRKHPAVQAYIAAFEKYDEAHMKGFSSEEEKREAYGPVKRALSEAEKVQVEGLDAAEELRRIIQQGIQKGIWMRYFDPLEQAAIAAEVLKGGAPRFLGDKALKLFLRIDPAREGARPQVDRIFEEIPQLCDLLAATQDFVAKRKEVQGMKLGPSVDAMTRAYARLATEARTFLHEVSVRDLSTGIAKKVLKVLLLRQGLTKEETEGMLDKVSAE